MSIISKFLSVLFVVFPVSSFAYTAGGKYFKVGNNSECYIDTYGNDWYWFCGNQTQSCRGTEVGRNDVVKWFNHGAGFEVSHDDGGNKGVYWCCNGSNSQEGKFVYVRNGTKSSNPFYTYTTVTETLKDSSGAVIGKCSWQQKKNICGAVENSADKCTTPTSCEPGYLKVGNKCVLPCPDGEGFASKDSANCVSCERTLSQGLNNGVCIKCESNQFFDPAMLKCVNKSDKLPVAAMAHNACWMCVSPGAMYHCLKNISNGGQLDATLQGLCSVSSKPTDADTSNYTIPNTSSNLTSTVLDLEENQIAETIMGTRGIKNKSSTDM